MVPTKRKAGDESSNPLLNAAKKAKKDQKPNASKRKLLNGEEQPGGLLIVRAPSAQPSNSQPSQSQPTPTDRPRSHSSQPHSQSQPIAGPSNSNPTNPSKKFRADSQPPQSQSHSHSQSQSQSSSSRPRSKPPSSTKPSSARAGTDEAADDRAIRAMEDEADYLRRHSRAHTTIDVQLRPGGNPNTHSNANTTTFNHHSDTTTSTRPNPTSNSKPTSKPKPTSKRGVSIVDTLEPLPPSESPQIARNKAMREGAMAAIRAGWDDEDSQQETSQPETSQHGVGVNGNSVGADGAGNTSRNGNVPKNAKGGQAQGHRRRSSVGGRGKRMSDAFELSGVIAQPHPSVSTTSFYKHIDVDLPGAERLRHLLIWSASRASSSSSSSLSSSTSSSLNNSSSANAPTNGNSSNSSRPPAPPLPALSADAARAWKSVEDAAIRMLASKAIDLLPAGDLMNGDKANETSKNSSNKANQTPQNAPETPKKANEQNLSNRRWEVTYGEHIRRAEEEGEGWKRVRYFYDEWRRREGAGVERRVAAVAGLAERAKAGEMSDQAKGEPSEKAKGKRRATGGEGAGGGGGSGDNGEEDEWECMPFERELDDRDRSGVTLSKSVLGIMRETAARETATRGTVMGEPPTRDASSTHHTPTPLPTPPTRESRIRARLADVEFTLDQLNTFANTAHATALVAERMLDQRFAVLSSALLARQSTSAVPPGDAHLLSTYVPRHGAGTGTGQPDPLELMRALTRIDRARPPAQVGDAARSAARVVARVEESGLVGAVGGERRLTVTGSMGSIAGGMAGASTPRKAPGTPRRGNTPGREGRGR